MRKHQPVLRRIGLVVRDMTEVAALLRCSAAVVLQRGDCRVDRGVGEVGRVVVLGPVACSGSRVRQSQMGARFRWQCA